MGAQYDTLFGHMGRKFSFAIDEYYHIYNRGTDKRTVFLDEEDWQRFSALLYLCNSDRNIVFRDIPIGLAYGYERGETLVDIGAYCLMPNHFHILVREKVQSGISLFMQKFSTAYSMYFNIKYERTGGLFEGPFRAKHADSDNYLKYLFSYIHLNPVKIINPEWKENGITDRKKAKQYLADYSYSSYLDYMGTEREGNKILNKEVFPQYFENFKEFEQFIDEWIVFKDSPIG
jgi:putative transposase